MNPFIILLLIVAVISLAFYMLGHKTMTGRLLPKVDLQKATYMFVLFAWIGFVVIIIYLAWIQ